MLLQILLITIGLGALLGGGDLLVRGASALAKSLGVSTLVIGLTVVAFGTSAPELSINLLAALKGNTDISFGNIIGSNISNIGLIIGCAAVISPLAVEGKIITRELPMMFLAALAALVMGSDAALRQYPSSYDRVDGIVYLLFFSVFIYYTTSEVLFRRKDDPFVSQAIKEHPTINFKSVILNVLLITAGLALLIFGGKLTVDNSVRFAEAIGISKAVIGLTIIAVGTSLPELVTSIMATVKGETDLAIGNVVGSNIFNILFVLGASSVVRPIAVPEGGQKDLIMMVILSALLLPLSVTQKNKIVRSEGIVLLIMYFGYTAFRVLI